MRVSRDDVQSGILQNTSVMAFYRSACLKDQHLMFTKYFSYGILQKRLFKGSTFDVVVDSGLSRLIQIKRII